MKKKAMAISLMLTFTSCVLFAQEKTDTIPKDHPKTDTISTKKDTTINAIRISNINPNSITVVIGNPIWNNAVKGETVYAIFPTKENDEISA